MCRGFRLLALSSSLLIALLLIASAHAPAQAQTLPAVPPQSVDPKACSDPATQIRRNNTPPGKSDAPAQGNSSNQTLSQKLENSDGVLCPPPDLDPSIKVPTPDVGTTPTIPPPGSPGGDPTVRPK